MKSWIADIVEEELLSQMLLHETNAEFIERVCGMAVPTEEEIWTAIKASPGAAWDAAKGALDGLPSMPEVPEFGWPSLPEIGMPSVPDINWKFWK